MRFRGRWPVLAPPGRHRLIGDDVNVEVRRDGDQPLHERLAPEERVMQATRLAGAPHDDLRDAGQSRELGDLKGDVVPIHRFHLRAELFGEGAVR